LNKKKKEPKKLGAPKQYTPAMLKKLGEELVEFVKHPDIYHLCEWTRSKGYSYGWWKSLKDGNKEILQAYHEQAKEILGHKILKNAFECNNSWAIQTFIPKYLGDVKDHLKEQEEEKLDRQKRLEKYKHEIGQTSHETAKAKIDQFDINMELMERVMRYEKLLEQHGLLDGKGKEDD